MKKIIILDFASTNTYILDFDENVFSNEEITEFFDTINEHFNIHLKESNCQWMIVESLKLEIL